MVCLSHVPIESEVVNTLTMSEKLLVTLTHHLPRGEHTMKRIMIVALAAWVLLPTPATARTQVADTLFHRINALRVEHGRERLRWDQRLVPGATEVAKRLVTDFEHSTTVELNVGWTILGEAIAWAYDVDQVWELVVHSDAHRSMLMKPRWDRVGIGHVRAEVNGGVAHCEIPMSHEDCITAGLEWFPARGLFVAIWVYDEEG